MAAPIDPTRSRDLAGGFAPSRRALERFAIGIPTPEEILPTTETTPSPPRTRHRPRHHLGNSLRSVPSAVRVEPASTTDSPPPPDVADRLLRRRVATLPLVLLVPGPRARELRTAGAAAIEAASRFSGYGREIVLVDLDPGGGLLPDLSDGNAEEGIADVLFFGVSLHHAARSVPGREFRFLPRGAVGAEPARMFDHPRWPRVLAEADRRNLTLLAFTARSRGEIEALAHRAAGVLLLAHDDEEKELRTLLPDGVEILATLGRVAIQSAAPDVADVVAPVVAVGPVEPLPVEAVAPDPAVADDSRSATEPDVEELAPEVAAPEEADPDTRLEEPSIAVDAPVVEHPSMDPAVDPVVPDASIFPEAAPDTEQQGGRPGWRSRLGDVAPALFQGLRSRLRTSADAEGADSSPADAQGPGTATPGEPDFEAALRNAVEAARAPSEDEKDPTPPPLQESDASQDSDPEVASLFGRTFAEWLALEEQRTEGEASATPGEAPASAADPEVASAPEPDAGRIEIQPIVGAGPEAPAGPGETPPGLEAPTAAASAVPASPPVAEQPAPEEWVETTRAASEEPAAAPLSAAVHESAEATVVAEQGTAVEEGPMAPESALAALPEVEERQPTGRYTVPRTSAVQERVIHVAVVLMLAYWIYYIGWRWSSTLNLDALWFSVPLALAETWGLLTAIFLTFTTWRLNHRTPIAPEQGLDVDVFITTFDEPIEVVRRTAISARQMRYPHRTYVLDDGRREEVRAMAEEMGIGYIRRENNEHAKAGNLNNALKFTSGDFILQLDADHAPLPHLLDRLLGFFQDPLVAFVQTPQDFYNTDSFTSDVSVDQRRIWEEQRLFFSVIQPGKDSSNSAFFCGSCAVIRRSALDDIGGFSTESVTEDIETSLLLHARGWKSVYYGESLAYGLAAGSADAFHTQHMRWAQGAMQVLRTFSPLSYPGLTLAQRIGYFYSLVAYVTGLQKLIFYLAPIVFFVTGVLPIRALDEEFLIRFFPYLLVSIVQVEMLSRGMGFTWIAERYQMAKFWTYTRALPTFLTRKPLRFRVTRKGPGRVSPATYAPHLVLMVLIAFSVNWATFAYSFGWVDYSVDGWRSLAFQLNFLWALVNFVLAAYVVRLSVRLQERRKDHRFADRFPIELRTRGIHGQLGERQIALTENLNASGLAFRSVNPLEVGAQVALTLPLSTEEVMVSGSVVHMRRDPEVEVPIYVHGVSFHDVSPDARDAIEIHCAHHAVPIEQMKFSHTASVLSRAQDWVRNAQGEQRRRVRLPTWVLIGDAESSDEVRESMAFLEEISESGAYLIMNDPVEPGTHLVFEVPGTGLRGEGPTVFSRALETPIGVRFAVGMRRETAGEQQPPSKGIMKNRRFRQEALAIAWLLVSAVTAPAAAYGQAQVVLFGSAEADAEDQTLLLLGASVQAGGMGLQPVAGLTAYRLTYPIDLFSVQTVNALNPSLGLRYQWPIGAVQGSIGYLFLSSEGDDGFAGPGGTRDGVTTDIMADYWGTGARTAQALASFNWADGYVWSRVRAAQRIAQPAGGDLRLGGELILQGGGRGPGEDYRALQIAPMVQFQPRPWIQLIASAGAKTDNLDIPERPNWFPYGKLEFVLVP